MRVKGLFPSGYGRINADIGTLIRALPIKRWVCALPGDGGRFIGTTLENKEDLESWLVGQQYMGKLKGYQVVSIDVWANYAETEFAIVEEWIRFSPDIHTPYTLALIALAGGDINAGGTDLPTAYKLAMMTPVEKCVALLAAAGQDITPFLSDAGIPEALEAVRTKVRHPTVIKELR